MRLAWISLFAVANALGPSLCCCATALWLKPEPVEVVAETKPACRLCCSQPDKDEAPPPESPNPIRPCPCHSAPPIEMTVADAKGGWTATVALPAVFIYFDTITDNASVDLSAASARSVIGPFMTKDVKLYAHHVLRC